MNNTTVSTQMILTSNFVKYNRLSELIYYMYAGSNATNLNLYIDLYGVIKTLFSDSYRTDISDYTAVTSTILNMCAHYRSFFKRLGVTTKIFLVFSYNVCDINRKFVAGYNDKFYWKMQNETIKSMVELNCNLLETICPFLPNIHFVQTNFESSVLIDYLIKTGDGNPNLIISKDIYPMQLTTLHPMTGFIKPRKLNGEDVSVGVSPRESVNHVDDFWNVFCSSRGSTSYLSRASIWIHPVNFAMLAAMNRFPERGLKLVMNSTNANKAIFTVVGKEPIKVSTESVAQFGGKTFQTQIVDARFKALDVEFCRELFNNSVESKMIKLIDLNDPASVNAICAEYFSNNPVDLSKL